MNKVILMGRLTRDPDVRYTQGDNTMCVARYTLAVDRRFNRRDNNDGNNADFISCVAFGKSGEFAERYLHKGTKIAVSGRLQTGSYTNKDGQRVFTTDVVIEDQEFAESRNAQAANGGFSGGNSSYGGGNGSGNYGGGNNSYGGGNSSSGSGSRQPDAASVDGFMNIPEGIDEELPFT